MPREMVEASGDPFAVKVGWAADRDVQLGVETEDGKTLPWILWGSDAEQLSWLSKQIEAATRVEYEDDTGLARAVLNTLDCGSGVTEPAGYRGVWATLSRHGCNRLIRLLRKARDAAYGADA